MYFVSKNNKKEGPYTLEEVLQLRLTDDMLVWKDGIDWSKVSELPELKQAVIKTPPPLPSEIEKEAGRQIKARTDEAKKKASWNIILVSLGIGLFVAFILNYFVSESSFSGNNQYPVYHSYKEENDHSIFYWKMFPFTLLIVEVIALIVAGIKIAMIKPDSIDTEHETKIEYTDRNPFVSMLWMTVALVAAILFVMFLSGKL